MNHYDIKRLALVFATQAEIEAMKIANKQREMADKAPAYSDEDFNKKAFELTDLAYKHDEQL